MNIAIACGGTGGHVFPGLAVADELAGRGHVVTVLSTGRDVETQALASWSGDVADIGLGNCGSSNLLFKLPKLSGSLFRSRRALKAAQTEVLLAMGGYASIGPVLAARSLGIPVVVHEGNAVAGNALKYLSRFARAVATNFSVTAGLSKRVDAIATGFPVRRELIEAAKLPANSEHVFGLLVIGGSQGARFLNELLPEAVRKLVENGQMLKVFHVAGEAEKDAVEGRYSDIRAEVEVYGFVQDMVPIYARADAAVSRSGASVCAELSVFGIPSMLIPFPAAKDDHQTANARHYAEGGGVELVDQADMTADRVCAFVESIVTSGLKRRQMRDGMLACAKIHAARDLADIVLKTGRAEDADI